VGIETDDSIHRELALRATLNAPMQRASAWALVNQLEHLAAARTLKSP